MSRLPRLKSLPISSSLRGAVGTILSAFLSGYAIGLVPGGWLADRFGPHGVLTTTGLAWAVTIVAIGCIPSCSATAVWLFVAARFLLGLCEACAFPTFNRTAANWMLPTERARSMGLGNGISAANVSLFGRMLSLIGGRRNSRSALLPVPGAGATSVSRSRHSTFSPR